MNIQQLKTFITVVDAGSFSAAARVLGVSQPAVTMQVQNLESDINQSLLDRRYRRIELTEAGKVLVPYAREMLAESEAARAEINALSGEVSGPLHIALSTTPGDYIIPRLLGEFLREYPDVTVRLTVTNTSETVEHIEDRDADIGMVGALSKSSSVKFTQMGSDELILITGPGTTLAQHVGAVALKELSAYPWVARSADSGTQQVVKALFAKKSIDYGSLHFLVELGTGEAVVNAVEGGLGIAIVSRYVAAKALALGTIVEIECEDLPLPRSFYLVTPKRTLTRAASAFVDFLATKL